MKTLISIALVFVVFSAFSQNTEKIERLQRALQGYRSGEEHWGVKHDKAYRLLSIDKYNNVAIFYLLSSFEKTNRKDSITWFFNNLIENNKNDVEAYLIREEYNNYERSNYTSRINNLKKALAVDSLEPRANYLAGKLYYELFIKEYTKNSRNANTDRYAWNVWKYYTLLYDISDRRKEMLMYPLVQLSNYFGRVGDRKKYESNNKQSAHFPISEFVALPGDWESNYSVNVLNYITGPPAFQYSGVERALFAINWYSEHLDALDEPVLTDSLSAKVFRFLYLRTFHNPVVIGLENNNGAIRIYWKVCDGAGGYDPGKIIENKSKELTLKEWDDFVDKINSIKFWSLSNVEKGIQGTDGSQWILEGRMPEKYHVVDRWGGGKISGACHQLIELTDLKLERIY